jgi:phosphomannomutase
VKHQNDGEWILVLPDADRPLFNVYAEAKDDARAWTLVQEYADKLERMRAP